MSSPGNGSSHDYPTQEGVGINNMQSGCGQGFLLQPRSRLVLIKGGGDVLLIPSMFVLRKTANYNQDYNQGWNKILIALNDLIIPSLNVL